jgi:hypothetical protein
MNFRDRVCAHLSAYRKGVLNVQNAGIYLHRGRNLFREHILPLEHLQLNILRPYGDQFFLSEHKPRKLHKYFHHLNSSQALCINLFFPLIAAKRHDLLASTLRAMTKEPMHPRFESESTIEVAKRKTSFDFHLHSDREDIFVEVKYTESGFGAAKNDDEHGNKFVNTYLPLLKKSLFLERSCQDRNFFLRHYQVLRNLVHITERSQVVFLFPRANDIVADQAAVAQTFLTESGRKRLHILFLEDVVADLTSVSGGNLRAYYHRFTEKYLGFSN